MYLALNGGGYELLLRNQAALFLWWGLAIAFAFGVLPVAKPVRRLRFPLFCLAGLIGWTALALTWTDSQERTVDELSRLVGYAGVVVLVVAAVHRENFRQAAAGLTVALLAIPALAVAAGLAPEWFPPGVLDSAFAGDRLLYPLGYWNALASWSAMAIAIGIAWSAHARAWHRQAALAAVPIAVTALYLTYSRAGVAVAVFGVLLVIGGSRHRWTAALHSAAAVASSGLVIIAADGLEVGFGLASPRGSVLVGVTIAVAAAICWCTAATTRRWGVDQVRASARPGRALMIGLVVVAVAWTVVIGPRVASRAFESFAGPGYASQGAAPSDRLAGLDGSRSEVWPSAVRAFGTSPLNGIGPGTFAYWWVSDVTDGEDLRDAHSLYLETLAELGLPGGLLLAGFLGGLVVAGLSSRRGLRRSSELGIATGLLAVGAVFLLHAGVDWMWEMGAVAVLGLGALSLVAAAGSERTHWRRGLGFTRALLVVGAVAAGALQIPGLVATERLVDSERLLALGFEERAADLAQEAIDAEPWAAAPRAQAAFVALADDRVDDAREAIRAAIQREPTNWRHPFLLARIEILRNDEASASAALADVARLNPSLAGEAREIRQTLMP